MTNILPAQETRSNFVIGFALSNGSVFKCLFRRLSLFDVGNFESLFVLQMQIEKYTFWIRKSFYQAQIPLRAIISYMLRFQEQTKYFHMQILDLLIKESMRVNLNRKKHQHSIMVTRQMFQQCSTMKWPTI